MTAVEPTVDVVVVAYGDEALLPRTAASVLAATGIAVRLVVVDNGFTCPDRVSLEADPRITWVRPGRNTGFAGGCNLGAKADDGEFLAFVNSDAVVSPDAVAELVAGLDRPGVVLATGCVVLDDEPDTVNAAGNPVHYSMLSWAGGWGEPVSDHRLPAEPASVSGALFAVRRSWWERLGGFHEALFAYGEDVELSLRTAMAGGRVGYVPAAVARHHYEFHRNPGKLYLLERNRLLNLLTLYERRTLLRLGPGLLLLEAGMCVAAARAGWWQQKVAGYRWLWRHRGDVRRRRAVVQSDRTLPDSVLLPLLETTIDPSPRSGVAVPGALNRLFEMLGPGGGRRRASERARGALKRARTPGRPRRGTGRTG